MIDIGRYLDSLEEEVLSYRVPVVDLIGVQSRDSYRVLIATILSSRTKDEVTAAASSRLFDRAPDGYSPRAGVLVLIGLGRGRLYQQATVKNTPPPPQRPVRQADSPRIRR